MDQSNQHREQDFPQGQFLTTPNGAQGRPPLANRNPSGSSASESTVNSLSSIPPSPAESQDLSPEELGNRSRGNSQEAPSATPSIEQYNAQLKIIADGTAALVSKIDTRLGVAAAHGQTEIRRLKEQEDIIRERTIAEMKSLEDMKGNLEAAVAAVASAMSDLSNDEVIEACFTRIDEHQQTVTAIQHTLPEENHVLVKEALDQALAILMQSQTNLREARAKYHQAKSPQLPSLGM